MRVKGVAPDRGVGELSLRFNLPGGAQGEYPAHFRADAGGEIVERAFIPREAIVVRAKATKTGNEV